MSFRLRLSFFFATSCVSVMFYRRHRFGDCDGDVNECNGKSVAQWGIAGIVDIASFLFFSFGSKFPFCLFSLLFFWSTVFFFAINGSEEQTQRLMTLETFDQSVFLKVSNMHFSNCLNALKCILHGE